MSEQPKIVWAWTNPYGQQSILEMGVPKYEGVYGWQLLEQGTAYCEYCTKTVSAPHNHTRTEIDNYKHYGTIAENGYR